MARTSRFRIATYNIHKCRGLDGRTRPERVARIVAELDADVIALQEVLRGGRGGDQLDAIAAELRGYEVAFGENREHEGSAYGNAVLSRLPVEMTRNYDLTWRGCERRGCLRVDVRAAGSLLHIFNVHLGTAFVERRHQGRQLSGDILGQRLRGHRIVLGDFNEWTRGLASRLLSEHLQSVDVRRFLRRRRTYPGILPVLHLDHFYYDDGLELEHFRVYRTRASLVASDHLPMVAEFARAE
jgi:endonuclease/exonuclease/phosphatase family metal-dependent hydrolase